MKLTIFKCMCNYQKVLLEMPSVLKAAMGDNDFHISTFACKGDFFMMKSMLVEDYIFITLVVQNKSLVKMMRDGSLERFMPNQGIVGDICYFLINPKSDEFMGFSPTVPDRHKCQYWADRAIGNFAELNANVSTGVVGEIDCFWKGDLNEFIRRNKALEVLLNVTKGDEEPWTSLI